MTKFVEQCNYLQAMEGDYDPSHARFLHSTLQPVAVDAAYAAPARSRTSSPSRVRMDPTSRSRAPSATAASAPRKTACRASGARASTPSSRTTSTSMLSVSVPGDAGRQGTQATVGVTWWMPIFCTAGIAFPGHYSSNMRIPIDNESLMFYRLRWSWDPITEDQLAEYKNGGYTPPGADPRHLDAEGQPAERLPDRPRVSEDFSYSGIKTFPLQDIALIEAQWGPIAKREYEHLVSSDYMIIHVRQRLLKAAKEMQEGKAPEGPFHPEVFRFHRENAIANTAEEAVQQARSKALAAQIPERMPEIAVSAG